MGVDRLIAVVAERHGGHITCTELLKLGLTSSDIAYRVRIGRLIPVYHGVYAVGSLPTNPLNRAMGALLACGGAAALDGRSASALWRIESLWPDRFEVITPDDRRPSGITVRRSSLLLPRDIQIRHALRVTSPALTLLRTSPRLDERRLKRAIEELRLAKHLRPVQLDDVLDRFPRHPGARPLRAVRHRLTKEPTRSYWEDDWPPFATRYGLTGYVMNEHVCGHRADVYFPAQETIFELDGWETHQTQQAFEDDRERDIDVYDKAGIPTFRITYDRLTHSPDHEAERIRSILSRRRRELLARRAA